MAKPEGDMACGVQGCLFGAVGLFVLLLIALLITAIFRFGSAPSLLPVGR